MKILHTVTFILVVVGALNWGLVGAFDFNLVAKILGTGMAANVVYILVGLAAVYEVATHKSSCKACDSGMAKPTM